MRSPRAVRLGRAPTDCGMPQSVGRADASSGPDDRSVVERLLRGVVRAEPVDFIEEADADVPQPAALEDGTVGIDAIFVESGERQVLRISTALQPTEPVATLDDACCDLAVRSRHGSTQAISPFAGAR